jgi:release factor glutamine methyltransferase
MHNMDLYQQLLQRFEVAWNGLRDKPEENPANTVRALWLAACGQPVSAQQAEAIELPALDELPRQRLSELIEARLSGTPLSYLSGRQRFMGLDFIAAPQAMIPRQETEILGRAALSILQQMAQKRGTVRVMDLCTGSGNLLLTLMHSVASASGVGSDLSPEAIELAEKNAGHLKLSERVQFRSGDLFAPFESSEFYNQFDLVMCNPPYIGSKTLKTMAPEIIAFEPHLAFDGGPFGIQVLTRLIKNAPRFLKAGSWLCFEIGTGQGEGIARMLKKMPDYSVIQTFTDNEGEIRALAAKH